MSTPFSELRSAVTPFFRFYISAQNSGWGLIFHFIFRSPMKFHNSQPDQKTFPKIEKALKIQTPGRYPGKTKKINVKNGVIGEYSLQYFKWHSCSLLRGGYVGQNYNFCEHSSFFHYWNKTIC